jgi:hypothetical protein
VESSRAAWAVGLISITAVAGPPLGLSPAWLVLTTVLALAAFSVDAALWNGRGGHLLAERLPGGQARLRRIALHEAGHRLVASHEGLQPGPTLVGTLACLRAGRDGCGSTELPLPPTARLPLEDLRRWTRVLLAGGAAERLVYGSCRGDDDDRRRLGRLWGLSGQPLASARLEQRRARREVEGWLAARRPDLEAEAERLLAGEGDGC